MSKIAPIYKELASKILMADLEYVPRILAKLANLEQARILQALPDPDRESAAGRSLQISEKCAKNLNLGKKTVDRHIQELFEKGVLFPTRGGPQMARTLLQLHDACLGNPKFDKSLGNEFFDLWASLEGKPKKPVPENLRPERAAFRVVPKWKSIADVPGVLPHENLKEMLKTQELLVLLHCGCKRSFRERECGIPDESCITVGRTAQYNLERGAGRKITYEEALAVLDKYDEHGTVNLTINQKGVNQLICNCHWCCCNALKGAAKSRFIATVNAEECRGCKTCVKRCQYGAVQMKFYPEFGAERAYVDAELCRGCGNCVTTCPAEARKLKVARPPEHIPESLAIY
jgi:NAD-dependent dihydropyrimidine dehydrogenase PreA subunit